MGVSGSIRKVLINGRSYNATGDGNPARMPTQDNEGIRHSGGVNKKVTLMAGSVESLKLTIDDIDYDILSALSEQTSNFPMSYEKADGTVIRCGAGFINIDNYEASDNNIDITMTSETGKWQTFSA